VSNSGYVKSRTDYQAFGEEIQSGVGLRTSAKGFGGGISTRQGYGLTEKDDSTGLNHTWFRKNENRAGRWTSPDPYNGSMSLDNPQSFNRYSYVNNQPANYVDPSGLQLVAYCQQWTWVINHPGFPDHGNEVGPRFWVCFIVDDGRNGPGPRDVPLPSGGVTNSTPKTDPDKEKRDSLDECLNNDSTGIPAIRRDSERKVNTIRDSTNNKAEALGIVYAIAMAIAIASGNLIAGAIATAIFLSGLYHLDQDEKITIGKETAEVLDKIGNKFAECAQKAGLKLPNGNSRFTTSVPR
jgi:RHS repeat-associated protein